MTLIKGRLFATIRSECTDATLSVHEDGSVEIDTDNVKVYSHSDIEEISDRIGNIPRRITFYDGVVFETDDNDAIDQYLNTKISWLSFITPSLERLGKPLILLVVLAIISGYFIVQYGIPYASRVAALQTPDFIPATLDRSTLSTIDEYLMEETTLPVKRREELQSKFAELLQTKREIQPGDDREYQLLFRNGGTMGANAFALPGGTIIATDEFIELAKNDDEIISVLAHEIGHVEYQHGLQQIYKSLGIYALIGVMTGGSVDFSAEILSQGAVLLELKSSRGFETEADEYAIELLKADGKDPRLLADILDRLIHQDCDGDDCEDGAAWLSTHPASDERINHIHELSR